MHTPNPPQLNASQLLYEKARSVLAVNPSSQGHRLMGSATHELSYAQPFMQPIQADSQTAEGSGVVHTPTEHTRPSPQERPSASDHVLVEVAVVHIWQALMGLAVPSGYIYIYGRRQGSFLSLELSANCVL